MDDGKQLEQRVFALIAQAAPARVGLGAVTLELSLRRDLGLDSLGLATLLFNLGEELAVDPNDFIEMLAEDPVNTVADMVALGARVQRAQEGSTT